MALEPVAQFFRDLFLQGLDLGIDEFDHLAGVEVDQVIVVFAFGVFVPGTTVAEIDPLEDARLFEQLDGAIDRGDRDIGISRRGAGIEILHVRMIRRAFEHLGDGPALVGHAQAFGGAAV